MKKKILATSVTCGPCHAIKNKLKGLGIEVEIKEHSSDTNAWFVKHNIRSVPRLVIEDGDDVQIIQGMDDIIEAIKKD
jgi:glutaredoxin